MVRSLPDLDSWQGVRAARREAEWEGREEKEGEGSVVRSLSDLDSWQGQ